MQQVGRQSAHFALALAVPTRPSALTSQKARRAVETGRRILVVHRVAALRILAALLMAVLIAGAFQLRGGIATGLLDLRTFLTGEFAATRFGISEISITGQMLTREPDILQALALDGQTSTVGFDAEAARERIMKLPAIADANIRKIYPNQVIVTVTERHPVARWRIDGITFAVDQTGAQIADAAFADSGLPLVIGDGAGPSAWTMVQAISRFPALNHDIAAFSRIANRRWDIIYDNGLRVQLPELDAVEALSRLDAYQTEHQLLDRDLSLIDLRLQGSLVVRLNVREPDTATGDKSAT